MIRATRAYSYEMGSSVSTTSGEVGSNSELMRRYVFLDSDVIVLPNLIVPNAPQARMRGDCFVVRRIPNRMRVVLRPCRSVITSCTGSPIYRRHPWRGRRAQTRKEVVPVLDGKRDRVACQRLDEDRVYI